MQNNTTPKKRQTLTELRLKINKLEYDRDIFYREVSNYIRQRNIKEIELNNQIIKDQTYIVLLENRVKELREELIKLERIIINNDD